MAVFVNFKICDNADECSGIEACPTGALYWDKKETTLAVDNDKCISCDACVEACPAGAILVAHNDSEATEIKNDIANDPRTFEMLMVERFGASPVDGSILISVKDAAKKVEEIASLLIIDVIDDEDAPCLINSVPIAELFGNRIYEYYKISVHDEAYDNFADQYSIDGCPSLLVLHNHKLLLLAQGAVENGNHESRTEFIRAIESVL